MSGLMLDTNIISYVLKRPVSPSAERFRRTPAADILISSVVEAELRYGVARLPKEAKLPPLVEEALGKLTIVPWDSACAKAHATVRSGLQPLGFALTYADSMIAAHAIALDRTLVTNDEAFRRVPNLRIEYWEKSPGDPYK